VKRDRVSKTYKTGFLLQCLKINKNDPEKTDVLQITDRCHLNQGKVDLACITHPMQTAVTMWLGL
jgi:hypothetical protein